MKQKEEKESRPYHHGDLRNALIESAVDILREEGFHGLTLRKTAARAGVSHSAPYRHFPSKEALIAEISRMGFAELTARGQKYISRFTDAGDRLKAYGFAYVEFAAENPTHFRIMFGQTELNPEEYPELKETGEGSFYLLLELVVECQKAKIFEAGDPYRLAAANWSYVHGMAHLLVDQKLDWMVSLKGKDQKGDSPSQQARILWESMQDILIQGMGPHSEE
ncbi:MAG TPA: TetR/AcrR family transcriptional regulator [Leptospiraceae bacterium]|nr:TetR family transcriptional regulator [Spirochaetaceae bacterium]HBS05342.1 TetR/AcrR family transcriptional regulator [Leptospiraceae bacterium]|tara:strand:+ start:20257 stop:20922 length:666 start_codon:yes stop_codon:yes gene_type:complete